MKREASCGKFVKLPTLEKQDLNYESLDQQFLLKKITQFEMQNKIRKIKTPRIIPSFDHNSLFNLMSKQQLQKCQIPIDIQSTKKKYFIYNKPEIPQLKINKSLKLTSILQSVIQNK